MNVSMPSNYKMTRFQGDWNLFSTSIVCVVCITKWPDSKGIETHWCFISWITKDYKMTRFQGDWNNWAKEAHFSLILQNDPIPRGLKHNSVCSLWFNSSITKWPDSKGIETSYWSTILCRLHDYKMTRFQGDWNTPKSINGQDAKNYKMTRF